MDFLLPTAYWGMIGRKSHSMYNVQSWMLDEEYEKTQLRGMPRCGHVGAWLPICHWHAPIEYWHSPNGEPGSFHCRPDSGSCSTFWIQSTTSCTWSMFKKYLLSVTHTFDSKKVKTRKKKRLYLDEPNWLEMRVLPPGQETLPVLSKSEARQETDGAAAKSTSIWHVSVEKIATDGSGLAPSGISTRQQ